MDKAQTYLKQTSQEIEKGLNNFSNKWNKNIENYFPELLKLNKRFSESLYGGKMLRGTLVKMGYELGNGKLTKEILKPAAAFEILHTSLLVHDDIIDQSPMRRGKPSIYVCNKNKHYGISQAICLGDLGITQAIKLISESNFPVENKDRALDYFLQIISNTILGEMLDVEASQTHKRTEEQVMKIHQMKTANYTITGPLSLGAILAGKTEKDLRKVELFGEALGIAFQIQDDLLGGFGDEKILGKPTNSDIEENKSTLLIIYALKHANKKQKHILKRYYGKKKITIKQREMIKEVFEKTGSLAYSQKQIKMLTSNAKAIIPILTKDKNKQILLTQLVDVLIERKK